MSMRILRLEQTVFTVLHWDKPCYQLTLELEAERANVWNVVLVTHGEILQTELSVLAGTGKYPLYVPVTGQDYVLQLKMTDIDGNIHEATCPVKPQRDWEISFVPICHHDYGYTEVIDRLQDQFCGFYEDVLTYCAITDSYPDAAKYRYTVECTWSLLYWLQRCSERSRELFLSYAKSGRIDVLAFHVHVADVNCTSEELIRLMYPAFELQRKYGILVESAAFVDMPGLSWGVPKVLRSAGIKYFFAGIPTYFEWEDLFGVHDVKKVHSFWDENAIMPNGRPFTFHWEGQDGAKVLTHYQGGYGWFLGSLTPYYDAPNHFEEVEQNLPGIIRDLESRGIQHNCIRFIDHGNDNYPPQIYISNIVKRWNEKYLSPKLRVDTNTGFFQKLENSGVEFPVLRGEVPHTDYNVQTLSFAKEQTLNNVTHTQVHSAETLAAMCRVLTDSTQRQTDIDQIYRDMLLFDEHCVGMSRPFGRIYDWNWSSKSHHAYRAAGMSDEVLSESAYTMASRIKGQLGDKLVTVFNPTSTPVTDVVTVANFPIEAGEYLLEDILTGENIPTQLHIIDNPQLPVPYAPHRYSMFRMGNPERSYATELQFVARNVPACGYRSYLLRPAQFTVEQPQLEDWVIENEYYRLEADPVRGTLHSVWDKVLHREFADSDSDYGFGQVVVRSTVTEEVQPFICKGVICRRNGPVVKSLLIKGGTESCPQITVEFILYSGIRKIDVSVRLLKDYSPLIEGFVVFPFAVDAPQLLFDGNNCIVRPFDDQFPGSNTNYYSVQDWAMVNNNEAAAMVAPLESHIMEFGGLWHTYVSHAHHSVHPQSYGAPFVTRADINRGTVGAMLFYSSARTNFSVTQTGDFLYRFSLQTGDANLPYGNFRQTNVRGLVPVITDGNPQGTMPAAMGLFRIREENVRIMACKLAEDNPDCLVLRFEERHGIPGMATIEDLCMPIACVELLDLTEQPLSVLEFRDSTITVPLAAYEIKTLRIHWKDYDPSRCHYSNDRTVEFRY